ncbi:MAG: DUF6891 domain-containing protein [Aureispira sp.]
MDEFDLAYLWRLIWWGLTPEEEIINTFTTYIKGQRIEAPDLREHYHRFQQQKETLLLDFNKEHFLKLEAAFYSLNHQGILAIHYAGSTMSAGHTVASETLRDLYKEVTQYRFPIDLSTIKGYCFYHEQDIEPLVPTLETNNLPKASFNLAFGSFDEVVSVVEIGQCITTVLEQKELPYEWSQEAESRILLKDFVWGKENDSINWGNKALDDLLGEHRAQRMQQNQDCIFEKNQKVSILEGVFKNYEGVIKDIKADGKTLVVEVVIFGRKTLVELHKNILVLL